MKITITAKLANVYGVFGPGDKVDWPDQDAQPLLDRNKAKRGWPRVRRPLPKDKPQPGKEEE